MKIVRENNFTNIGWFTKSDDYKVGHGKFQLSKIDSVTTNTQISEDANHEVSSVPVENNSQLYNFIGETRRENLVPEIDKFFVKHGNYDLISTILASRKFYPFFYYWTIW